MAWWIPLAISAVGAMGTAKAGRRNVRLAREEAALAREDMLEQRAILNKQMDSYKAQTFKNPYAENVYEDLTVNQKQAQFQSQQGNQRRADLLQNLKGAAGGSGIGVLAQALANQGTLEAQGISAGIGQQESRNQAMAAQGQSQVQAGEDKLQQMNLDKESTLLGTQFGLATGSNRAYNQAEANVLSANSARVGGSQQSLSNIVNAASGTTFPPID